ncbi:retrovirus-related pol polyprotein from transposon TNT 1-94, partial [Tanacetum coccineum]
MTFDETPPPFKTSPLVDDDLDEEEAIKVTEKKSLENDIEDETLEIDKIVNVKEFKNHLLENVIGNLNQITLGSQAQNKSNFFCFISTIEPKNINEALKDESWTIAMQEELNQFVASDVWELVPHPKSMKIIGTKWVYRNKLDKNGVVSRNKARLVAQGYNQQEGIDCDETYAPIMHDESEMSMVGELNFFFRLQIKQMKNDVFFNQSKYIKEKLKNFGLEDSKPMKTPMLLDMKLTKDEELSAFVHASKRISKPLILKRLNISSNILKGTMQLGLWYPKGTDIDTVVYADSDPAGDYVDRKSTSGICTFVGCCLTSWLSKKQTALAISTTEAEYVSAGKACQHELWMKQALIDYNIRLDDVLIMCDNKGAIDLKKPSTTLVDEIHRNSSAFPSR